MWKRGWFALEMETMRVLKEKKKRTGYGTVMQMQRDEFAKRKIREKKKRTSCKELIASKRRENGRQHTAASSGEAGVESSRCLLVRLAAHG